MARTPKLTRNEAIVLAAAITGDTIDPNGPRPVNVAATIVKLQHRAMLDAAGNATDAGRAALAAIRPKAGTR